MSAIKPRFAFRFWQIKPNGKWEERTSTDHPIPPKQWQKNGFEQDWYGWEAGETWPLEENSPITPRRATSIIWCQPQQCFFVVPRDCTTGQGTMDPLEENWHQLYFHDLGTESIPRPGLCKLLTHGTERQLAFACPDNFDEFMPKNFFQGKVKRPCHFVGELSLILALHALVPEEEDNINKHIRKYFFCNNQPYLQSCRIHNEWNAMDRFEFPGRALVMQTGLLSGGSSEGELQQWENGNRGSMTSSHHPNSEEKRLWGVPD